jgi:hypothetical protein
MVEVFVAADAERWCRDGSVGVVVDPAQNSKLACGRRLPSAPSCGVHDFGSVLDRVG